MRLTSVYQFFIIVFISTFTFMIQAVTPVTGIWGDTTDAQKRTGYTVETQNGLLSLVMYSYADDNATTDPTWYIMTAPLVASTRTIRDANNKRVQAIAEARNASILTVRNNQIGQSGNVIAGRADIYLTDRETLTIDWNGFSGHSQNKTTLKKYWFYGGITMQGKRLASIGVWQYAFDVVATTKNNVENNFVVEFLNPRDSKNRQIYQNRDKNVLMGRIVGDTRGRYRVSKVLSSAYDYTVIYDTTKNIVYHFKEIGGGSEFSAGTAAVVINNPSATPTRYPYRGIAVRRTDMDLRTNKASGRASEISPLATSALQHVFAN